MTGSLPREAITFGVDGLFYAPLTVVGAGLEGPEQHREDPGEAPHLHIFSALMISACPPALCGVTGTAPAGAF